MQIWRMCTCVCMNFKWTNVVCKNFFSTQRPPERTLGGIISWQNGKQAWNFSILNWIFGFSVYECLTYCCWHTLENICLLHSRALHFSPLLSSVWVAKKHFQQIKFLKHFFLGRGMANKYHTKKRGRKKIVKQQQQARLDRKQT